MLLMLLSSVGVIVLVSGEDVITKYIGLELMIFSSYIMVSIKRRSELSTESGIKYYVLGGIGSGFWLIGASVLYISTGELRLEGWGISEIENGGVVLLLIGLLFKLGVARYHQ